MSYWDENLLQGPPPWEPFPQVVGITVHLTFAARAYELARWYRSRGAMVVLGGLHVLSCPTRLRRTPMRWRSAKACSSGPRSSATSRRVRFSRSITDAIAGLTAKSPRRAATLLPQVRVPDHHQPDRHARLPQSLRLLLPGDRRAAHAVSGARRRAGRAEFRADEQPYGVFVDNNLGSRPEYLRRLCRALRPLEKIWSAAVSIDVTDDPSLVREMALAGCTGVFVGFESLADENLVAAARKPRARRLRPPRGDPSRQRHSGQRQLRAGLRSR